MDALIALRAHGAKLLKLAGCMFAIASANAPAALGLDVIQIEEDWQLVVANPDPSTFAPQVTTTMSPLGDLGSWYAILDMNLRNLPSYEAGGLQLQVWDGSSPINSKKAQSGMLLTNNDETITWTQRMTLSGGQLSFTVVNGNSDSWGQFGSGGSLAIQVQSDLVNLNQYDPAVTVANSGIGYSANRVTSLVLVRVRAYSAQQLEFQDDNPRTVYVHP